MGNLNEEDMGSKALVETGYYFIIVMSLQIIGSILCIILLVTHCYKYCKHIKTSPNPLKTKSVPFQIKKLPLENLTNYLTIIMMLSFTIAIVTSCISTIAYLLNNNLFWVCSLNGLRVHCCGYTFGKGCMYLIFVIRLYAIYHDTAFEINHIIIKISGTYSVIMTLITTCLGYVTIFGIPYNLDITAYNIGYDDTIEFCNGAIPMYTGFIFVGNDFFITIATLIIFIMPLRKMIKKLSTGGYCHTLDKKFRFTSTKVTILTLSAVCSTMISMMFLMMSSSNALLWIDCVTNSICIMLMTPYYPGKYKKICCGLIKCVKCCCGPVHTSNDEDKTSKPCTKSNPKTGITTNSNTDTTNNHIAVGIEMSEVETNGISESYKPHELQLESVATQTNDESSFAD